MNNLLETILKDCFTLARLQRRVRILKSFLENKLFSNNTPTNIEEADMNWLKSLGEPFFSQFNQNNLYQIFTDTEAQISKLSPLIIYFPFTIDNQTEVQIGSFIRKLFPTIYLFDAKFDPNLIAGCSISWRGVLKDYSLRARVEEKKTEILSGFKKYVR